MSNCHNYLLHFTIVKCTHIFALMMTRRRWELLISSDMLVKCAMWSNVDTYSNIYIYICPNDYLCPHTTTTTVSCWLLLWYNVRVAVPVMTYEAINRVIWHVLWTAFYIVAFPHWSLRKGNKRILDVYYSLHEKTYRSMKEQAVRI
jgi:hypothetical protein